LGGYGLELSSHEVVGILISITAISSIINYKFIKLPKSIGVTLVTLVMTLLLTLTGNAGWDLNDFALSLIDGIGFNETFLHGMLSFLLFAGSLHINVVELSKHKVLVAILATVSVVMSTTLIGYATYGLVNLLDINLPFYYCFVFGALISPTDPIAVLGILKQVNAPKSLELKIAGEALFNDGMGIVLFFVASAIASGKQAQLQPLEITWFFTQQVVGGVCLGFLMGHYASKLMRSINDAEVAIILTLAIVTGGYTFSHGIGVSGPICMAVAGLVLGNCIREGFMSEENIKHLDYFWELMDDILNSVLFVLIGLEFISLKFDLPTILASLGVIIISIAARWFSISVPVASLSLFRRFDSNTVLAMTWGGLRGGISIALALSLTGPYRQFIVSITYSVVLFSMLVQGLTIGPLVSRLTEKQKFKRAKRAAKNELAASLENQVNVIPLNEKVNL